MFNVEMYSRNGGLVTTDDVSFTFESVENPRELEPKKTEGVSLNWINQEFQHEDFIVYPYGQDDNLPREIRDVVIPNYIAPGILTKKTQLLWGKGPKLYREVLEDNTLVKKWVDNAEIQQWLDSWDAEDYLVKCAVDFHHMESCATMFYRSRGGRLGEKTMIAKLEHRNLSTHNLARKVSSKDKKPTHCLHTPEKYRVYDPNTETLVYPLFDPSDPFRHPTSYYYYGLYSFLSDIYSIPDLYGSLEWLRRSSLVPQILKALANNSINLKYHIQSPQAFWDAMRDELITQCNEQNKQYEEKMLLAARTEYLRKVTQSLSGADNTGKFWHTVKYVDVDGHNILEQGWTIDEIPGNLKDLVDSNIKINQEAARAVAAGVGMHPALGGAGEAGKADSGSEQLYALKNYLITGIDIPEMVVCKALNHALKINWPNEHLKIGFYHMTPEREQDITSKDRIKENI